MTSCSATAADRTRSATSSRNWGRRLARRLRLRRPRQAIWCWCPSRSRRAPRCRSSRCAARSSWTPTTTTRSATARSPAGRRVDDHQRAAAGTPARFTSGQGLQQHLCRPPRDAEPPHGRPGAFRALAIAGDDDEAKKIVTTFLDSIGYDALDVGPLSEGWRYQRDTSAYVTPYVEPGTAPPTWTGRPVSAAVLTEALNAAQRYRDM